MAFNPAQLSDDDLLHAFMAEHLDGELSADLSGRFASLLKNSDKQALPELYKSMRGRLQLGMQSFYLKDSETAELRALVQDPDESSTQENVKIEQIGRKMVVNTLLRRLALVVVAAGVIGGLVWKFAPRRDSQFKALEYLGYEALAMEEDSQLERLNLPSKDLKEIRQYLATYPGLDFKPSVLKAPPAGWAPEGATVIDYEVAKVAVVKFGHSNGRESLFHFSFAGEMADLPKAEAGKLKDLTYQVYSSPDLNLVAWQAGSGVLSILVGRRGAVEMAEIAQAGSGR